MKANRRRVALGLLLALFLVGGLWLARGIEREVLFSRKRDLATRLDVLARELAENRVPITALDSSRTQLAAVRWITGQGGQARELDLVYQYEVPARLNSPVVVTLHVRVAATGGVMRVVSARVDEPFMS